MSYTRVFNDFKRRLLNGEVPSSFNCSAYLMNSNYENITENLQYLRSIHDFAEISANSLNYSPVYGITGDALAAGKIIKNDYYREKTYDKDSDFTSDPVFVTSANSAEYMQYAATTTKRIEVMQDYINTYGGFFLVAKVDEFNKMCSLIEDNNCERYAVVLADDIENIIVSDALFNKTRQHPFRGVFDGNGFALQIEKMFVNGRTCGVFGYIADEGIVRNLIIQPAKKEGVSAIDIYSTSKISLDTIKTGQGDVRFGVLAGVNEGYCERVVVSANLAFNGRWRPNIYFTHNKYVDDSMDTVSLYCPEWESAPSYNVSDVTAISSYTNVCFPTQLCLNSEANLIPYVGYFGEAAFSHAVNQANKLKKPLYEYPMSGKFGIDDFTGYNTTNFCCDIEILYDHSCTAYNKAEGTNGNTYSPLHVQGNVMQNGTFRLGQNHRAAYLIGGVFGLNNGFTDTVHYSGTMDFHNCTVALIGGIAGRQARGMLKSSVGCVQISTTSGAFADTITINLPAKSYLTRRTNATIPFSAIVTNTSMTGEAEIIAPNENNYTNAYCSITTANNSPSRRFLPQYQLKSSYIGQLSASASDGGKSDYRFDACKIAEVSAITASQALYMPETVVVNSTAFPGNTATLKACSFSFADAFVRIDDISKNPQTATIVTQDTNVYKHVNGKTTEDIQLVKNTSTLFVNLSGTAGNPASSIYCTVSIPLSATTINNYASTSINDDNRVKSEEYSAINITMPPLFHVGGYCGEYVMTDSYLRNVKTEANGYSVQLFDNDLVDVGGFAYLSDKAQVVDNDTKSRQYGDYNTIAGFAACVSLDTMNKSDCDTISGYLYTSATQRHYKSCYDVNFNAYNKSWTYTNSNLSSVFSSPAMFVKYFYYTSDMMPAVIMAASHGHSHSEGDTYEPNFGITWLDQLFYGTGITANASEGEDDQSYYAYWMKDDEWTDKYINTYAQAGYSENTARAQAQNTLYDHRANLISTCFKFNNAYEHHTVTAYVPRQQIPNNINTPYQYVNGRAGYNAANYNAASARTSAYSFRTTNDFYLPTTASVNFYPAVDYTDVVSGVAEVQGKRPAGFKQSYIFTYSSTPVLNSLPPIKLNMTYTTAYSLENMAGRIPPSEVPSFLANEHTKKCYTVTSDSYNTIYANNTYIPTNLTFSADDAQPITSNRLVYGFIPSTADIVKCLDMDPLAHLYCSGVSADDLQYLLIVDEDLHPILDIKLDVNSVENQGYAIEFDKVGYHTDNGVGVSYTYSGGLAINIENGNS